MAICKGILSDARKIAEALDFSLGDNVLEAIATENEAFVLEVLGEASQVCIQNKRRVISREDVQEVIKSRNLPFYSTLFK